MDSNLPELEQRLSNLQSQIERLWQRTERNVQPVEQRLQGISDQYAEYLKRWVLTVERHARAVTRFESYVGEWENARGQVQEETSHRLQELEATIKRDWDELRRVHEAPVKELRERAESLTEVCIATANTAQQGWERAEARLLAFEADLQHRMSELMRELQSAVAELKAQAHGHPARLDAAAQWSYDDVTRLHGQVRDMGRLVRPDAAGGALDRHVIEGPTGLHPSGARLEESQDGVRYVPRETRDAAGRVIVDTPVDRDRSAIRKWRLAVAGLVVAVLLAGVFAWRMRSDVRAAAERAQVAELELRRAAADATREAAAAREEAVREIDNARELAERAQRIGNVLAAPDLIRWNLAGSVDAPGASGQALFSRSRGFVVSGSGVPPAPANGAHQVWLLTRLAPVKAGTLVPEADGTVTLVQQAPRVPRAVVGVLITAEPGEATDTPTGSTVLTSVRTEP